MSDDDCMVLINMLAAMPDSGISLGCGLRKVRFSREGGGKRGEHRALYVLAGDRCLDLLRLCADM